MISLALIINTYNQPEYLARVLNAVSRQTQPPSEVLLADDGSNDETRDVFAEWAAVQKFRREHVWQKDEGFRRSRIMNLTISRAQSDYLVFLDGDTIPHPRFLADHAALAQSLTFVQGHRAFIKQRAAELFGTKSLNADRRRALLAGQLSGLKHAYRWPTPLKKFRTDLEGVRGCNLAVWRDELVRVNGYNEAFTGWGREDSELAVRLMNSGVRRLDVRGRALCYHLWHPAASRENLNANDELLEAAVAQKTSWCARGLQEHIAASPAAQSSSHSS